MKASFAFGRIGVGPKQLTNWRALCFCFVELSFVSFHFVVHNKNVYVTEGALSTSCLFSPFSTAEAPMND